MNAPERHSVIRTFPNLSISWTVPTTSKYYLFFYREYIQAAYGLSRVGLYMTFQLNQLFRQITDSNSSKTSFRQELPVAFFGTEMQTSKSHLTFPHYKFLSIHVSLYTRRGNMASWNVSDDFCRLPVISLVFKLVTNLVRVNPYAPRSYIFHFLVHFWNSVNQNLIFHIPRARVFVPQELKQTSIRLIYSGMSLSLLSPLPGLSSRHYLTLIYYQTMLASFGKIPMIAQFQ